MSTTRRATPGLHSLIGVVWVAVLMLVAMPASVRAEPGDGHLSVLVMGDSYSAGNGAGHYFGGPSCRRSDANHARRFAAIVQAPPYDQPASVTNVACSGDSTRAILAGRSGRPPQLAAVDRSHDVILLTIGGNDLTFGDIARACLVARSRDGATCGRLLAGAERRLAHGVVRGRVTAALRAVRAAAHPSASIVLLGYPHLEGDPAYTLREAGPAGTAIPVGRRLRAIGDLGDTAQRAAVRTLGTTPGPRVLFVPTKRLFAGHELSAARRNPRRWFVQPFADAGLIDRDLFYHPNALGWQALARLLARTPGVPTRDPVAGTPVPGPPSVEDAVESFIAAPPTPEAAAALQGAGLRPGGWSLTGSRSASGAYLGGCVQRTDAPAPSSALTVVARREAGGWRVVLARLAGTSVHEDPAAGPVPVEAADPPGCAGARPA